MLRYKFFDTVASFRATLLSPYPSIALQLPYLIADSLHPWAICATAASHGAKYAVQRQVGLLCYYTGSPASVYAFAIDQSQMAS